MSDKKLEGEVLASGDFFPKELPVDRPLKEEDSAELKGFAEIGLRVMSYELVPNHKLGDQEEKQTAHCVQESKVKV